MFREKARPPAFDKLPPVAAFLDEAATQRTDSSNSKPAPPDCLLTLDIFDSAGEKVAPFYWRVDDAFEGTQIFGETGSGKTSGSGAAIAKALLRKGFGGLILTAKTGDVYDWVDPETGFLAAASDTGQIDRSRVIVFGESLPPSWSRKDALDSTTIDPTIAFNFLDYEYEKAAQPTLNLVSLFLTALESGSQGNTQQVDAYWADALRQLLTNAIDLAIAAKQAVSLTDLQTIVQTAPQSRQEARSASWQKVEGNCWWFIQKAHDRLSEELEEAYQKGNADVIEAKKSKVRELKQTIDYWLLDFAGLADRTRSVIVSTFTSKVTGLTREPLYDLLCSGDSHSPNFKDIVQATRDRKLVILNLPVKRYTEVGRFAQVLIKTVWQRAIERSPDKSRPVFLWADEAQFFATKEDMLFQTTARSSGCATVYLTQNINNYYAMMPGRDPRSLTESLLGNLTTKIFHANGDPTTNQWAQRLFGNEGGQLTSQSVQGSHLSYATTETQPFPVVQVRDFATLRRGGEANKGIVDAIIFRSGFKHADRKVTVLRTAFHQARLRSEEESDESTPAPPG